jgi:hypothetical protein
MPFQRLSYGQLTAQINILSQLAAHLQELRTSGQDATSAKQTIVGRMFQEIERLENHRRKIAARV